MYRGYFITTERDSNGIVEWVAYHNSKLVAYGSKSHVFSVIDGILG